MFKRKKKPQEQEPLPPLTSDEDATFSALGDMFENVIWARQQISAMLEEVAVHKSDHMCEVYCIPPSILRYVGTLTDEALSTLLLVMLKDAVIQEEADEETW
jgi:hypothetical protein